MRKHIANTPCLMLLAPLFAITSVVYGVLFSRATPFDLESFRWRPLWVGQKHAQIWPYRGDDWLMQSGKFNPNEYQVYPYVANGYFGQTLPAEGVGYWIQQNKSTAEKSWSINNWPLDEPRATFGTIAGFYDLQNRTNRIIWPPNLERGGESVISGIPDWTGLVITTETGESYLPGVDASNIREYLQSMSLRNGVVQTNTTWVPTKSDALFQINYTVLAHQREINLGLVSLDLIASKDVDITITDVLDGAGATRSTFRNKASEPESDLIWTSISPNGQDSVLAYEYSTVRLLTSQQARKGDCEKASTQKLTSPWISPNASTVAQSWCLSLRAGVSSTVYKYVGIASTDAFGAAAQVTARNAALEAKKMTWENLISSHNEAWENLWESADIAVPGNKEVQKIARASLFHLLANLRPGAEGLGLGDNSISPSGLISDSYGGYIFWDADTWVAPSLFALHPDRAMSINNYRSKLHGQAKANIKANEFREFAGALYPWTSGRFGNCTGNGICAGYQYHINADIALAHWQYYLHTNDIEWLREKAWPIIFDAAEMFVDFVQFSLNYTQGTIWTFAITDPDEDAIQVNNGAYTNTAIKLLLGSWAPAAAELLNITIPAVWKAIADDIPIPMNSNSDLIEEYTGMTGDIQIKQADVVLLSYPLDYAISTQIARNNLEYYAIRNSPFGPQMTWSAHSISESQLQIAGCASYTYLLYSIEPYIRFPFYQFSELIVDDASKNGGTEPAFPFLTGHGGYLQIFTHGLTGMRPRQDVLYLDPTLPPQLGNGGVQINGIKWRGVVLDVDIQLDHTTINCRKSLSQCSKDSCDRRIKVQIGENNPEAGYYYLSPEKSLIIPTRRPSFNSQGNHALCKSVSSNATYIAGQFPLSVVDGSPSSTWQPKSSSHVASLIIDLSSYIKGLSRVEISWGAFPPVGFSVSLQNSHGTESNDPGSWEEVLTVNNVNISAPYEPERIKEVRMLERNRTVGVFGKPYDSRYVKLSIWGTQGLNKEVGATVAEFKIY